MEIKEIEGILKEYYQEEENLNLILDDIQEKYGYISNYAQEKVSQYLNIPQSRIYATVKINPRYSFEEQAKYKIKVCNGKECSNKGKERIEKQLKKLLNIDYGEKTKDGLISLEKVRCLGFCGKGPNMSINGEIYTNLDSNKVNELIKRIIEDNNKKH